MLVTSPLPWPRDYRAQLLAMFASIAPELVEFLMPDSIPAGSHFLPCVPYGSIPGADIAVFARDDTAERAPAVIFVHGGYWLFGTPAIHLRHAHALAERGYVTVLARYRLDPEATTADKIADLRAVVDLVCARAGEFGADPARITLAGDSAGAHLAAMVAYDPARAIRALAMWYPVTDLREGCSQHLHEIARALTPDPADLARLSPSEHISDAVPTLTMTGDADVITPVPAIAAFHESLTRARVPNELSVEPEGIHGFDFAPEAWHRCTDRLIAFLDLHMAVDAAGMTRQ